MKRQHVTAPVILKKGLLPVTPKQVISCCAQRTHNPKWQKTEGSEHKILKWELGAK